MNPRVLELLKNPKHIQSEDLHLLKEEINSFPYIQNIRALHLYGVHLFDKENYQKELSTTAAYTTDKKILYQLINGKIQQKAKSKPEVVEKVEKIEDKKEEVSKNTFQYVYKSSNFPLKREDKVEHIEVAQEDITQSISIPAEPEAVINEPENSDSIEDQEVCKTQTSKVDADYIEENGERNRILFEGEEDFMNETKAEETVEFTPEVIIDEDETSSENIEETINDEAELSFHEEEPLLPESNELSDITEIQNQELEDVAEGAQTEETVELDSEEVISEEEQIESVEESTSEKDTQFTSETIISEDEIHPDMAEETILEDDSELSFHGTDSFLPDVKIESEHTEEAIKAEELIQPNINKHEDEMRRLIEEVEKKMKETKVVVPEQKEEPEQVINHDISFAETQSFDVKPEENNETEITEPEENKEEISTEIQEEVVENQPVVEAEEVKSTWKPMSFESHVPDSLLVKNQEVAQPKVVSEIIEEAQAEVAKEEIKKAENLPVIEDIPALEEDKSEEIETTEEFVKDSKLADNENSGDETPVMNVSFFGSDISSWQPAKMVKEEAQEEEADEEITEISDEKTMPSILDSNVPGFINTWQSWLKIDRPDEVVKEKTQIKAKVIETFIENNPRISQLRDESSYVVKEKKGDISHLMTETLANLYTEQKLYTKAIKAFEILIKKHPERKKYFESKIQEVKDIRTKN